MSDRKRIWGWVRRVWATVGVMALLGFAGWSFLAYRASDDAKLALVSDDQVEVIRGEGYWSFTARFGGDPRAAGLLFFPGALVEPAAYAPLARAVLRAGHPVLLVELPRRGAFGGADGAEVEKSEQNRHLLPTATRWVIIEGANHSQFGWYGFQPGDRSATISRARQQELMIQIVVETLKSGARGDAPANNAMQRTGFAGR